MNTNANKETINKAADDNSSDILKVAFINSFISFENDRGIAGLINDLESSKTNISPELKKRLETWLRINEVKFSGLNLEEIKKKDIEKRLGKQIYLLHSLRTQVRSWIQSLYDVDNAKYENEIFPIIKEESIQNLRYILKSKQNIKTFIAEIDEYKNNPSKLPLTKDTKTLLESFNLESRWRSMNYEEQAVVYKILDSLKNSPIDADRTFEVEELLRIAPLSQDEKKQLIQKYLPITNLQTLLNHQIITKSKAEQIRFNSIKDSIDPQNLPQDNYIEKIANGTDFEDIVIETKKLSSQEVKKMVSSSEFISALKRELSENSKRLQEQLIEESEKDISSFKEKLSKTGKVLGAEKFQNGSILVTQTSSGTSFAEVLQDGSLTGQIVLIDKGFNSYDYTTNTPGDELSPAEFLAGFSGEKGPILRMTVFTKDEINGLIKSGKIQEVKVSSFKTKDEIETLYNERKEKLTKEGVSAQQIDESPEIIDILKHNENTALEFLNEMDKAGEKYGFKKGVVLKGNHDDNSFWTIVGIDHDGVTLEGLSGKNESFSFQSFIAGCEQNKISRVSGAKDENEMLNIIATNSKTEKAWEGVEIKDGVLNKKETIIDSHGQGKENDKEIEYLVSKTGEEFVKILGFANGKAEIQFGTIESKEKISKEGKKMKKNNYKLEKRVYAVSYGFLAYWVNKNNLEPNNLDGSDEETKDFPVPHDHRQWSLMNWWTKGFSIHNVIQGFHDIEHSIEHYFEGGQKEQAAKFAMKAFSVLPYKKIDTLGEIQSSLQADVEGEQKKRMDKQIEHLKQVDSQEAVAEIFHWLHYTNTPTYKIHAAMMFMIQNYGVLTAKGELADKRGEFIWYKALGGTPNDAFFKKVLRECEMGENGKGIPFSEEELVYQWLKELHKQGRARSRLHKEFKSARAEGKNKEYDTGLKDGGDERGIDGRVKFTMGELMNGNYPNALGGLQRVFEKGGSMKLLQKVPFVLAFSGICYTVDGKWTLDKIKNFPSNGWISPILRFLSYTEQMDQINITILEVARRIGELENDKNIYPMALDIFKNRRRFDARDKWSFRDKIKKTEKFYDLYGEKIMSALMLANAGDNVDSKYSGLIKIEKEEGIHFDGEKRMGNKIFKAYSTTLEGFVPEFKFEYDSLFDDLQRDNGLSGLDLYRIGVKKLFFQTGGKLRSDDESTHQLLQEIKNELEAIRTRVYTQKGKDSPENRIMQKKIAKQFLRDFIRSIAHNHGTDKRVIQILNDPSSILSFFNKYDVNFANLLVELETSEDDILLEKNTKFEKKLDELSENVINGGFQEKKKVSNKLETIIRNTQTGVHKVSTENEDPWLDQVA